MNEIIEYEFPKIQGNDFVYRIKSKNFLNFEEIKKIQKNFFKKPFSLFGMSHPKMIYDDVQNNYTYIWKSLNIPMKM